MEKYPSVISSSTPMKRATGMGFIANPGLHEFAGISPPNQRYQEQSLQEEEIENVAITSTPEEQRAL
jgi:hypothetical protein